MQSSFKLNVSTLLLTLSVQLTAAQALTAPNTTTEKAPAPAPHHFSCNTGYSQQECHAQMSVLRPLLDKYGASRLSGWTWVLIKSQDWKAIQSVHGMDPDSPAFTVLDRHETFFEEALLTPVPERRVELIRQWSLGMDDLLKLAVTHELGHALCNERNERKADAYGELLREGKDVQCK
jgi:hypothetical protein